jgi:tRNA (cmo5U34)-methyltransferase
MSSQQRIRSGFNFFAPFYDVASFVFFGNSILKAQTYFLPQLKKCKSVLIFGGGTGKLLIELLKQNVGDNYCYVDISNKMISKSRKRVQGKFPGKTNSIDFICGSTESIPTNEKFDLIITPCVLDCFPDEQLPEVMQQLNSHLEREGEWLFVDFNIPERKKSISAIKIRVMYFFFNVICGLGVKQLPDFKREFENINLKTNSEKYFLHGLMVARIYKN